MGLRPRILAASLLRQALTTRKGGKICRCRQSLPLAATENHKHFKQLSAARSSHSKPRRDRGEENVMSATRKRCWAAIAALMAILAGAAPAGAGSRIKDLVNIEGVREN